MKNIDLTSKDVVIGIAASGKTPYVIGGLTFANTIGATTVSISCNEHAVISEIAQYPVEVKVGPEVLTGSNAFKVWYSTKINFKYDFNHNNGWCRKKFTITS